MKALSLFSGIGGLDLAAQWAEIKVKAFCEIEPFPVEVLKKRFPGVHIFNDVKTLTKESFMEVMLKNGGGMESSQPIDIIFGGFPCQDLSQAGKQAGLEGERSGLWFEMLRVISEFRPRYVVAENVRGAVNLALDTVYSGLVGEGYKVYPYVIPASAVGAPHQRERLFVVGVREDVADTYCKRHLHRQSKLNTTEAGVDAQRNASPGSKSMENPGCELRQGGSECGEVEGKAREGATCDAQFSGGTLWPTPRAQEPGKTTEGYGRGLQELVEGKEQRKLWPTPVKEDYRRRGPNSQQQGLPEIVHKLWPTPSANEDACGTPNGKMQKMLRNNPEVRKTSGQLNPDWVGQLMGYPEGWTDLDVDEPREWAGWPALLGEEQYPFEFPRTTTGCKNRAKQLKAYGNSVVPAQAYPFFKAIVEIEKIIREAA